MTSDPKYRDIVDKALSLLTAQLGTVVDAPGVPLRDPQKMLGSLLDEWETRFRKRLPLGAKTWVHELKDLRNAWAHKDEITWDHAYRAVTSAVKLLKALSLDTTPFLPLLSELDAQVAHRGTGDARPTPRVAVVACTKMKRSGRSRAIEMYDRSPLFRYSIEAAVRDHLPVFIISTKYGVIDGDTVIDTYEAGLKTMSKTATDEWRTKIASQLAQLVSQKGIREIVFLAGADYREPVASIAQGLGVSVSTHPDWKTIRDRAFGGS